MRPFGDPIVGTCTLVQVGGCQLSCTHAAHPASMGPAEAHPGTLQSLRGALGVVDMEEAQEETRGGGGAGQVSVVFVFLLLSGLCLFFIESGIWISMPTKDSG